MQTSFRKKDINNFTSFQNSKLIIIATKIFYPSQSTRVPIRSKQAIVFLLLSTHIRSCTDNLNCKNAIFVSEENNNQTFNSSWSNASHVRSPAKSETKTTKPKRWRIPKACFYRYSKEVKSKRAGVFQDKSGVDEGGMNYFKKTHTNSSLLLTLQMILSPKLIIFSAFRSRFQT